MNNKTEKQLKDMENAMKSPSESAMPNGELPDDALDGVAGGAVLNSLFYIARCQKCGWQSCPFDNRGENDLAVIVMDHCSANPNCEGDFAVFNIDSRNVKFG